MSRDTAGRILGAALAEFSQRGYAGASMRRIAARVGVRAPSLYAHFASKEAILEVLLERQGPHSGAAVLDRALAGDPEPSRVLQRFYRGLMELWCRDEARQFRSLYERLPEDLKAQVSYLDAIEGLLDRVAGLFRTWARDGAMRGDVPARQLAWELLAPLGNLRTSYWAWGQSPEKVRRGNRLAHAHLRYFRAFALNETTGPHPGGPGGSP